LVFLGPYLCWFCMCCLGDALMSVDVLKLMFSNYMYMIVGALCYSARSIHKCILGRIPFTGYCSVSSNRKHM
jgi:hypothetical protein